MFISFDHKSISYYLSSYGLKTQNKGIIDLIYELTISSFLWCQINSNFYNKLIGVNKRQFKVKA